jgi:ActR/RegA family two-component response regulator
VAAFLDVGLPDGNGLDLAAQLRERRPQLRMIIASGYVQPATGKFEGDPNVAFLRKPFDNNSTIAALQSLNVAIPRRSS